MRASSTRKFRLAGCRDHFWKLDYELSALRRLSLRTRYAHRLTATAHGSLPAPSNIYTITQDDLEYRIGMPTILSPLLINQTTLLPIVAFSARFFNRSLNHSCIRAPADPKSSACR
jgi:hypothetical protein